MCNHHDHNEDGAVTADAKRHLVKRRGLMKAGIAAGLTAGVAALGLAFVK